MCKCLKIKTIIYVIYLFICVLSHVGVCDNTETLTFFGWSDQHVKTDGDGAHLIPAIDAMNTLPGRAYPANIGGHVDDPNFVIGLGDVTEWPTHAAKNTYEKLILERLKFPSYDVPGNHDSGGGVPSSTMHDWLKKRHGSLSYTFEKKGVHFIALYSKYDETLNNPAQPISDEALAYLRKTLSKIPKGAPIVVATHLCFESITNRDDFVDAFGKANVILVIGGHYHKASVNKYKGINFLQLPSPSPGSPSEVTVIRISPERLIAIPFDYEKRQWCINPTKILDARIQGPHGKSVNSQSNLNQVNATKSESLFLDTDFRRGLLLSYPSSRQGAAVEAILGVDDLDGKPVWKLCQWGTQHSLAKARCIRHANGDVSYGNEAKRVLVGAQNSDNRDLVLEIIGSAEYGDKIRKYGEDWPHLLVEQRACKIYTLDQLARLDFTLKMKLLYFENHMKKEVQNPALHAAQFQMFLVVKNVNEKSKNTSGYFWFGVPFYDNRYDIPPSYKARDSGKADATGRFIYTIAGKHITAKRLEVNEWIAIDIDLLPYIKEGLKETVKRGYFTDPNPSHYAVTGMNMGWELPGTFNVAVQVHDLEIVAVLM